LTGTGRKSTETHSSKNQTGGKGQLSFKRSDSNETGSGKHKGVYENRVETEPGYRGGKKEEVEIRENITETINHHKRKGRRSKERVN